MSFTPAQQEAIAARGNVLVVAGAGTGKTSTLVERCLSCLLDPKHPASLDEILMVTFTEAAATEMRQRIRVRMEKEMAANKESLRWQEQLALFDTAHIGTLHSFCLQLVRQHFYELELDPQLTVLPEEEAKLLADETLDKIFTRHYEGKTLEAIPVQQLIQTQGRGSDKSIRALMLKLHHYTQTLRDPAGWFEEQLKMFRSSEPLQWQSWLEEGICDWQKRWLPVLQSLPPDNKAAAECSAILQVLPENPSPQQSATALQQVIAANENIPYGKGTAWRKPLEDFFAEASFLNSLAQKAGGESPLAQDWNWVREQMITLLELAREFTREFGDARKELGVVDFHDLEQHALTLLWDRKTGLPTKTARQWREKLRYVFVDEYQDINDAQDAILKALSRDIEGPNRFLVGDVKQSIYRFRLADPRIFQGYIDTWGGDSGKAIPLTDNFRSREGLLHFFNSVFSSLMRREIGGVPYEEDAHLHFGAPEERFKLGVTHKKSPRVELHLRLKGAGDAGGPEGETDSAQAWTEVMNLEETAKEARLTGLRLRELRNQTHEIWDETIKDFRPVKWSDMAVLMRSPSGKAEIFAREFTRLGIPLTVARGGFYESIEIADLLSLLQLLDNPLQDLPALAVLHSPLVGMSLDDLASIRLMYLRGHCWGALQRFHEACRSHPAWPKVDRFLTNFAKWRRLARQVSLSRCLEAVLGETHYAEWLLTQPRGEQRHANVQRLIALAQQFDQFQRQGLFRFLRFIEAQQAAETEPQVAAVSGEDSVRLMSIHQSKGLEFPVVVLADIGKPFNLQDLRAEIVLDSEYGLCPQIKPPHTGRRYPSLPYWLAIRRQRSEMLGEEMRLLYVAMTRARDTLILAGNLPEKKFLKKQSEPADTSTASLLAAGSYLDWLLAWASGHVGELSLPTGESTHLRWTIYDDLDRRLLDEKLQQAEASQTGSSDALDKKELQKLHDRLTWQYPHLPATKEPAKSSVSALRRGQAEEVDAVLKFHFADFKNPAKSSTNKLSGTEVGSAHHLFLQLVALDQTQSLKNLHAEARRMELEQALKPEEIAQLDFEAIAEFWQSDLGAKILTQSRSVRRELAFTARFSPEELHGEERKLADLFDEEFVVVQGFADLVVLLPEEIWLVDFKTDRAAMADKSRLIEQYRPQLDLYAKALSRIYRRPVTHAYLHFLALRHSVDLRSPSI